MADAAKNHNATKETCFHNHAEGQDVAACCKLVDESPAKAISKHAKLTKRLAGRRDPKT